MPDAFPQFIHGGRVRYGEVQFYFYYAGQGLAMVSLYGTENVFLQERSSQAVWACGALTGSLVVIAAKAVICGVAMIPHIFEHHPDLVDGLDGTHLYLTYDKMGSDIVSLGEPGDEEND